MSATESDATDVGEDVVGDDKGDGKEEPNHAFEDVVHYKVCLDVDQVQGHMRPCKLGELEPVMPLLERTDEENEACNGQWDTCLSLWVFHSRHTDNIKHETNETMMGRKRQQNPVNEDDVLEVVDDALSVKKVHGRSQEVPIQ